MPHTPNDAAPASSISASRRARKVEALASAWRPDARLDAADRLRLCDPAAFAAMSPQVKLSLGHYLEARSAAAAGTEDTP